MTGRRATNRRGANQYTARGAAKDPRPFDVLARAASAQSAAAMSGLVDLAARGNSTPTSELVDVAENPDSIRSVAGWRVAHQDIVMNAAGRSDLTTDEMFRLAAAAEEIDSSAGEQATTSLAERLDCPEALHMRWATSDNWTLTRFAIMENPNATAAVLLACDEAYPPGKAPLVEGNLLAKNPNTPPQVLARLADVGSALTVSRIVAANPSAPPGTLKRLANSGDETTRCAVAENPATPPDDLRLLLVTDLGEPVALSVARNTTTPPDLLDALSKRQNPEVRAGVAGHAACPTGVLEVLAFDEDHSVRDAVVANPRTPELSRVAAAFIP